MSEQTFESASEAAEPHNPTLEIDAVARINFASAQNAVAIIRSAILHNPTGSPLEHVTLDLVAEPAFIRPKMWTLDRIAPSGAIAIQDRGLNLDPVFLGGLNEAEHGRLFFRASQQGQLLLEQEIDVELLARDEWGGLADMDQLLAAFVSPNDPVIARILKEAGRILELGGHSPSLDGYQNKDPRRAYMLVAAIWSAISGFGLTYAEPPRSFERDGQKVRRPGRINDEGLATCLDLSLLVSAAIEAAGLHPAVIFTAGHAFAGAWLTDRSFASVAEPDVTEVRKAIAAREFIAFETTLLTTRPATGFDRAIDAARPRLNEEAEPEFNRAIDINRARSSGIRPLASHVVTDETPDHTDDAMVPAALPPIPDFGLLPGENVDETPTTAKGRIERWQQKLLDLSLRNRLLNFRDTQQTVPFHCPDVPTLEDLLADGKSLRVISLDDENPIGDRDPDLFLRETGKHIHDDFTLEALDRGEVCVPLSERDMRNRLTTLYRKANSDMAEGGTNTLFLAAGFLRWKKTPDDSRAYRAPLLLIPIALKRRSAQSDFRLVHYEDEVRINATLLQFLLRDFGIRVPGLEDELPTDHSGLDLPAIFETIRVAVRDVPGFEVIEDLALSTFSFAKYLMWKDLVDRTDQLRQNRLVKHLIDNPDQAYETVGNGIPRAEEIDRRYLPADLVTPLPADSSQLAAVAAVGEGNDLVIIGPPGTGKSQTIANMIANCLAQGRSVLFVAEKSAALDVVHRRLRAFGLGDACLELHSNKADRRTVLTQLGAAWDRAIAKGDQEWLQVTDQLRVHRDELNGYVEELHRPGTHGLSVFEGISILAAGGDDEPPFKLRFSGPDAHDAESYASLIRTVVDLARAFQVVGSARDLQSVTVTDWSHGWQAELLSVASALRDATSALSAKVQTFQKSLGLSPTVLTTGEVETICRFASSIARVAKDDFTVAVDERLDELPAKVAELETSIATLREEELRFSAQFSEDAITRMPLDQLDHDWREANARIWPMSFFGRRRVRKLLQSYAEAGKANPEHDLPPLRRAAAELSTIANSPLRSLAQFKYSQTDTGAIGAYLDEAVEFRAALAAVGRIVTDSGALAGAIGPLLARGGENQDSAVAAAALVSGASMYRERRAGYRAVSGGDPASQDLQGQVDEMNGIARQANRLSDWAKWVEVRGRANRQRLGTLCAALESGDLSVDMASDAFQIAYMLWWLPLEIDLRPKLRRFAHWEQEDRITQFRELDAAAQKLAAEQVIRAVAHGLPARDGVPRKSELGALRHQLGLQRPSISIRKLISEMPETFTKLSPCVLMSPLSIAQYLPADHAQFDIVIFDEASQITTWDAIGAIARGRQSVIVGDPKQLPPTNFFGRAETDEEDLEQYEKDLPSILDEASAAGLPYLGLNWHYRSRDETLIAFSNHHYYGDRLVTFPSPSTGSSAVTFHKVDGVYARGQGRTNEVEARAITTLLTDRLTEALAMPEGSRPTFGVITFNAQQQELILDFLDAARREKTQLEWFFEDAREEPVIVKNLENIQGDERDIMLFSITFGKDLAGKLTMNFGAINNEGGEKRLNVAVTRARSELHVFASVPAEMIDLGRTRALGVRHLKAFLDFAERGPVALPRIDEGSLGPAESPFEEAVAEALRNRGWDVRTQIGVSGFRVDLGIVHPDHAGAYLAGVECDGATYHSSASARDRDRTREAVLRSLGWEIVRIWSTDWFANAKETLTRVDTEIVALLEASRAGEAEAVAAKMNDDSSPQEHEVDPDAKQEIQDLRTVAGFPELSNDLGIQSEDIDRDQNQQETDFPLPEQSEPAIAADTLAPMPDMSIAEWALEDELELDPEKFFDLSYVPTLQALISRIVHEESPIRDDLLVRAVARRHGWRRAGRRIRERVLRCISSVEAHEEGGNRFYWFPNTFAAIVPYRGLKDRSAREIARAEIFGLISSLPSLSRSEDQAKDLSIAMGLSRLTEDTRAYLGDCLARYAQMKANDC